MIRLLATSIVLILLGSCAPHPQSIYFWKTTLNWTAADTQALESVGVDTVGLRVFDWGTRGEEGTLNVVTPLPASLSVVPIAYVTVARLEAWAADPKLDAKAEAETLFGRMNAVLALSWKGTPPAWQLDADWAASTRAAWFSVAAAFGELVHERGARFEVTVRLHQYRDRVTQGVPPADGGVLMLYGVGDAVMDAALVSGYLKGPAYPLPLVPAFPSYTQVRQLNGYGRLVALHRLRSDQALPLNDLKPLGTDRYEVLRRSALSGRPLLAHDVLAVDRADAALREKVAALPAVAELRRAAGRVWFFDYEPGDNVPRLF